MSSIAEKTTLPEVSNGTLIRRLLAMSWRYRGRCLQVLTYQLILLAMGLSGLRLSGLAIDYIRYQVQSAPKPSPPHWPFGLVPPEAWSPIATVWAIGGGVLLLALMRALLNYLYAVAVAKLVQGEIVVHLRAQVYDKLQRLSFRFFDANASGSLINRVTGDVQNVRAFVDGVLIQSVIMVLSLVVYLCYMLSLHVQLTIACLCTTPLLWIATTLFSRLVRPAYAKNRDLVDTMVLSLSESVQGIHVTKGFAREPQEIAKFAAANDAVRDQQQRIFWRVSIFQPSIEILTQLNMVILIGYGGYLVATGQLELGAGLIVFSGLVQQFSGQISQIANIANTAQQSLIGARRVFEILDAPVEVQSRPTARRLAKAEGAVIFEHVAFAYQPDEPVLVDIDFAVEPGQCVAILGATGSGKSTLLSMITRFYDPTAGRVLIDGVDARELDLDDLRRNIGLVFQESFLFSNTVAANIAFGHPEASREQIERAARIASAHDFIMELPKGYDTVLGESAVNLSGGQRQRLAIARAVILEPPILLLDDPTAAIDPQTETEILEAMDQAIAGRTTFIVAHRLSTLRRADRILVLEHGRIAQAGTHQQLMSVTGQYHRVAKLQLVDDESLRLLAAGREKAP